MSVSEFKIISVENLCVRLKKINFIIMGNEIKVLVSASEIAISNVIYHSWLE